MSNLSKKNPQEIAQRAWDENTLFSNRCAIQCGTFSVPQYNPFSDSTNKVIRLVNYSEEGIQQFVNIEAFPTTGLPTTTDLTYYLALQKLLDEDYKYLKSSDEQIQFSRYDLLKKIGLSDGDANYQRLAIWGQRMTETAIRFFETKERRKTFGTFSIFQEFITKGMQLEDDSIADENWIRLTKWEIDNRLTKPLIPIDFITYLKIKNKKAQLLIPHLQVWLFASRKSNVFRKNYNELCGLLGIIPQRTLSAANRQFNNTFKILIKEEYLKKADIYESGKGLVVELYHGAKFFRDLGFFQVIEGGNNNDNQELKEDELNENPNLLPEAASSTEDLTQAQLKIKDLLVGKEIDESHATQIIKQRDLDEIELIVQYCEFLFEQSPNKYRSRRGYLFTLLKDESFNVPHSFLNRSANDSSKNTNIDEPLSELDEDDLEFEKEKWLLAAYNEYCIKEAQKQNKLKFEDFNNSFRKGNEIWNNILNLIDKSLKQKQIFSSWFQPIAFAGLIESESKILLFASQINADWVNCYYSEILTEALASVMETAGEISWIIKEFTDEEKTDPRFFYNLVLIENFKKSGGISFENFVSNNQELLDEQFESSKKA